MEDAYVEGELKEKLKQNIDPVCQIVDKKALHKLSYGLCIVTAREDEKDNGCIVNTVVQVTSTPLCIAVTVNKRNCTHNMMVRTGKFNVSVLTKNSKFETYRHWGLQSGNDVDKLEGREYPRTENEIIYIEEECNAYFCAEVMSIFDLGTHTMFLAQVTGAQVLSEEESVTYDYYQKNIKEVPVVEETKKGFICTVCGYIYEGDTLPEDFVCPWCKHPASDFKPL